MELCKDCKWFDSDDGEHNCNAPNADPIDPVTGDYFPNANYIRRHQCGVLNPQWWAEYDKDYDGTK